MSLHQRTYVLYSQMDKIGQDWHKFKIVKLKKSDCQNDNDNRTLFYMKDFMKKYQSSYMKLNYGLFRQNYRVPLLSTLYLIVSGIIMLSLKSIWQF